MQTNDKPSEQAPRQLLAPVTAATVQQFEHQNVYPTETLYNRLKLQNPELALYIRRRSTELAATISERETMSRLALETLAIISNQQTINDLQHVLTSVDN